jgi:hypothetical protein
MPNEGVTALDKGVLVAWIGCVVWVDTGTSMVTPISGLSGEAGALTGVLEVACVAGRVVLVGTATAVGIVNSSADWVMAIVPMNAAARAKPVQARAISKQEPPNILSRIATSPY